MSERWFEELIQVAKEDDAQERQRLDERWDQLAAGTLSAAEAAVLKAEAETSEEGRAAWEAFRPLGAEFQVDLVRRVQAQRVPRQPTPEIGPAGRVVPFRGRVPLYTAAGLLAAGLAAFALLRPFLNPALPTYTFSANTGSRGEAPVEIGRPATFALQPSATSRGRVAVQCVLIPTGEAPRFWSGCESHFERHGDGVLRITLSAAATAELQPGRLRVLVGRPGRFPPPEDPAEADPARRWQAFELDVLPPL